VPLAQGAGVAYTGRGRLARGPIGICRDGTAVNIYAGGGLDRAALKRRDDAWLAARRADPASLVLLMDELRFPVSGDDGALRLMLVPAGEAGAIGLDALFLGLDGGRAVFACRQIDGPPPGARFAELRSVGALLPAEEAGLAAYARGLAFWQGRQGFCNACGGVTSVFLGGHGRRCRACRMEHFPRTDPAVIVLVHKGEHCLLGRSARFVPGMYSTLAGFVEPGESLEQAVAREVLEETGIHVLAPRYHSSQPWPFPASLMLGFHAEAADEVITLDIEELDDARWLSRAELSDPLRCPIRLPGQDSIARRLIEDWLAGRV
jgi:NAD+ diphosphatase